MTEFVLKDDLEIFLITYNRELYLKRTLKLLFALNSPVRDCQITVLDNKSPDRTAALVKRYQKRFPNLELITHNRNISGNGNICRAMELASKKYFWILCDDDSYDWTHWDEIQSGLEDGFDAVLTERNSPSNDLETPVLLNEMSFVPACIYKTENLTDVVMQNAMVNIYASFPHLALATMLINENKRILIPEHTVIRQGFALKGAASYVRGLKRNVHFRQSHVNLFSGYINSYQMIADKKLRWQCCDVLWIGESFLFSMKAFLKENGWFPYNIYDVFNGVSPKQKALFLYALTRYGLRCFDSSVRSFFYARPKLNAARMAVAKCIFIDRRKHYDLKMLMVCLQKDFPALSITNGASCVVMGAKDINERHFEISQSGSFQIRLDLESLNRKQNDSYAKKFEMFLKRNNISYRLETQSNGWRNFVFFESKKPLSAAKTAAFLKNIFDRTEGFLKMTTNVKYTPPPPHKII